MNMWRFIDQENELIAFFGQAKSFGVIRGKEGQLTRSIGILHAWNECYSLLLAS